MSNLFKARESILSARTLLKESKLLDAVKAVSDGLAVYLMSQVMVREKKELAALLEKALYLINTDQEFRKLSPEPIGYKPGEEKRLFVALKMFEQNYEKLTSQTAAAEDKKAEEGKLKILEKAEQYIERGNFSVAATVLKRLFEENEEDVELRLRICHLLFKIEQYEDALNCFLKLEGQRPQAVAGSFEQIAVSYWKTGQYDMAEHYFELTLAMGKSDAKTYFRMGIMLIERKKMNKACEMLQRAVDKDPGFTQAKEALAFATKRNL